MSALQLVMLLMKLQRFIDLVILELAKRSSDQKVQDAVEMARNARTEAAQRDAAKALEESQR